MKYRFYTDKYRRRRSKHIKIAICLFLVAGIAGSVYGFYRPSHGGVAGSGRYAIREDIAGKATASEVLLERDNPLAGKVLYRDSESTVAKRAQQLRERGDIAKSTLLDEIALQPAALWLIGPSQSDAGANRDLALIQKSNERARNTSTLPVYQLYAIPIRDGCAVYSAGGFSSNAEYYSWLDKIINSISYDSVFSVEADAISQTVKSNCLNPEQKKQRYELLKTTINKLQQSQHVLAVYLDAGHPEWFPDPSELVEPLVMSGVMEADGLALNVSNYVDTQWVAEWSKQLVLLLGGKHGVVIDTSRNGRGGLSGGTGEERWCNPRGRGLGNLPSVDTPYQHVDAYLWIKAPGESDGSCFGFPSAGTFVDELAFELAANSLE